jgi:hypothetical protein
LEALCVNVARLVKHFVVSGGLRDQSTQIVADCSGFENKAAILGDTCAAKIRARHPKNADRRP